MSKDTSSELKLIKSTFYKENKTKQSLVTFIRSASILSFSTHCEQFEKNFARFHQRKHAVFVNSGSSANLAMIQALLNLKRLKIGDKVGFSALTWSTNVMPIIQLGLDPVPIDVELDTLNVSSKKLEDVLERFKLKAVFLTNLLGFCDDIDEIASVCKKNNVILLEDNCESLGSVYKRKLLGNYSLMSSVSFYVGHHLSTIEGGMVVTDDEQLATMLRIVRAHGWDRNLALKDKDKIRSSYKINSEFYSRYTFYDLGYNLRPTEIAGFLGTTQLQYADEIIQKREENFLFLADKLYKNTDQIIPIRFDHMERVSNFAFPMVCTSEEVRKALVKKCAGKIESRPIVGGDMTQQPFFTKYNQGKKAHLRNSNAKKIHSQGFYFGNNPELSKRDLRYILQVLG